MSDTEDLLAQLRFAAEVEREAYKQEGATYINPMATICGRAATTIEEAMKMLIERDDRIAQLEAAARWIPVEKGMHLPDEDAYIVRISRPKGYDFYAVAQQTEDGGLEDMDGVDIGYESRDISHWMPLPQPPSKEPAP